MTSMQKVGVRAAGALIVLLGLAPGRSLAAGGTTKYPWNIPDNVRIVQPAPVDGVRTFATIQAAINSITTASATNPFVVKVMAGTYTESVVIKDYVSLVGSGPDATILQDDGTNPAITSAASMIAGFSVANLTIQQRSRIGVSIGAHSAPVVFRNVTLKMPPAQGSYGWSGISQQDGPLEIHDSRLLSAGTDIPLYTRGSVLLSKSVLEVTGAGDAEAIVSSNPTIRDSVISVTGSGSLYGVMVEGGTGTIVNSEIIIRSTATDDCRNYGVTTYSDTSATIRNSRVVVTVAAPAPVDDAALSGSHFTVDGSVLSGSAYGLIDKNNNGPGGGDGPFAINNSNLSGAYQAIGKLAGGANNTVQVGNSRLSGGHNLVPGEDKVVGCYDANYNPIPNQ